MAAGGVMALGRCAYRALGLWRASSDKNAKQMKKAPAANARAKSAHGVQAGVRAPGAEGG